MSPLFMIPAAIINMLIFITIFGKYFFLTRKEIQLIYTNFIFFYLLGLIIPTLVIYFFYTSFLILWCFFLIKSKHLLFPTLFATIHYVIMGTNWIFTYDIVTYLLDQNKIEITPTLTLATTIGEILLYCIGIYVLNRLDNRVQLFASILSVRKKHTILSLLLLATFISFIFIHITRYSFYSSEYWLFTFLFFIFFLCVVLFILYATKSKINQIELMTLTKSYQQEKAKFELYQDFKHDYAGILLTLSLYLENNQVTEAITLLKEITTYSNRLLRPNLFLTINKINIIPIRGLLMNKANLAEQKNIGLTIKILEEVNDINMNIIDFSRCITILIDNAIEAAEHSGNNGIILIEVNQLPTQLNFTIQNNYPDNEDLSMTKIQQKNYSTKANHTGRGLYIINKIVNRYSNCQLLFAKDEELFTAKLNVMNKQI